MRAGAAKVDREISARTAASRNYYEDLIVPIRRDHDDRPRQRNPVCVVAVRKTSHDCGLEAGSVLRPEVDGEGRVRSRFYLDVLYAVRDADLQRVPGREPVNPAREPRYRFVGPGPLRRSADWRRLSKDGGRPVPVSEVAREDRGGELVQHLRECLVVTEGAQLAEHHLVCGRLAVGVRHYPLYYFRASVVVRKENEEEGVVVGPLVEGFLGRPVGPEPRRDYPGVPSRFVPCHRISRPVRRTFGEPAPEREAAVELSVLDRVEDLVGNLPVRGRDAAVIRAWRPVPVLNLEVLQACRCQGTEFAA